MQFFSHSPNDPNKEHLSHAAISARALSRIFTLLRFGLALTLIALTIWLLGTGITILFASVLLSIALYKLAEILRKPFRFLSQPVAVLIITVSIFLLFGLAVWLDGTNIADQFVSLKTALETETINLKQQLSDNYFAQTIFDHLPLDSKGNFTAPIGTYGFGFATGLLSSAVGLLATGTVIIMAAFYFAMAPDTYIDGFLRLVPPAHRPEAEYLLKTGGNTLGAWMGGQAVDMVIIGALSGTGLAILGVPLAGTLGVVAGLCNFVPYIGAFMGAIPALLISISVSSNETLLVAILYGVIQFCEGNIISPMIQRRAVSMPPSVAILAQTLFGTILGVPGLILASPLAASCLAIMDKALPPIDPAAVRKVMSKKPAAPETTEEEFKEADIKDLT